MRKYVLPIALICASAPALAQNARSTTARTVPPAMAAITEADLKRDLYFLAGDALRGREAGTLDELRASGWIAEQLHRIGVEPLGNDGSYFQWFHLRRTRLGSGSTIRIGERSFTLWTDIAANANNEADVSGAAVWVGDGRDTTIDVRGKVVIAMMTAPASGGRETSVNSSEYRYAQRAIPATSGTWTARGAAAVIVIADTTANKAYDGVNNIRQRGTYGVDGLLGRAAAGRGGNAARPYGTGAACGGPPIAVDSTATGRGGGGRAGAGGGGGGRGGGGRGGAGGGNNAPVFLVRHALESEMRALDGKPATIRLFRESFLYPSVNIVGVVRGTDAQLRNEYVMFSSHQDHDGVRYAVNGDSIWNGADDNGTVSVALLAAARAFVKQPGRRSALFVYHGAEERGLWGSYYYQRNPIVPLAQTVAVLNGDMLGRNSPDSASLMGGESPHMTSRELVDMALDANKLSSKFKLDSLWDRTSHPEGWYRRSDHLPYAEACVPALMYSANLHPDYHTPRDEPSTINYPKLHRMTQWMYLTGWFIANTTKRPALEPVFDVRR